jgi:sterol desaturase/sphingolipid hydroxylase (fatty acid hydroxylase superfamily)
MSDWLVAQHAAVLFYALLVAFAVVAVWESVQPRRRLATATTVRWFNNIALAGIGGALERYSLPILGVSFAVLAEQRGWGLLNAAAAPAWLSFAFAVIALDLAHYLLHRLLHKVPLLWRMHKVHHADLDVDCVTAVRHHPLETLFVSGAGVLVIGGLGAPPLAVLAAFGLASVASIFNHGNVDVPPSIDRMLRLIVVTPDMHRIHHSVQYDECNANFSMVFAWWDRLFGTWCEAPRLGHESMSLGLAEARTPSDVTLYRLLLLPLRRGRAPLPAQAGPRA